MRAAEYTAIISKFGRKLEKQLLTDFDSKPHALSQLQNALDDELTRIQFLVVEALMKPVEIPEDEKGK